MQSIRSRLSRSFVRRVGRKSPMNKRRTALCTWQARTGISSALRVLHVDGKCRSNETMSCWWAHSPCVVGAHSTARRVGRPSSRSKNCPRHPICRRYRLSHPWPLAMGNSPPTYLALYPYRAIPACPFPPLIPRALALRVRRRRYHPTRLKRTLRR